MICNPCARAADYGVMTLHKRCESCDCRHKPIEGQPRLKADARTYTRTYTPATVARTCLHCGKVVTLNKDGRMRRHRIDKYMPYCPGSGIIHD